MARFNLLHLLSDYFRNPVFRHQFGELSYSEQLAVMRQEYMLNEAEVAAVVNHQREAVELAVYSAVLSANVHQPPEWQGTLNANTMGSPLPPPQVSGPAPGWPGGAWVTLESVTPTHCVANQPVALRVVGWNIDPATDTLELHGPAVVRLSSTIAREPTNRCIIECGAVSLAAGTYSVMLMRSGAVLGQPGHLRDAITVR